MDQGRGILFLSDPLNAGDAMQKQIRSTNSMTLIFDENGRYLALAQEALWRLRQKFEWICVAAEGRAACIAIALAAQLPVDRIALAVSGLFGQRQPDLPRELLRLEGFARRNLSLVISEILLVGAPESEERGFQRGRNCGKLCVLEENNWANCQNLLTTPWEQLC